MTAVSNSPYMNDMTATDAREHFSAALAASSREPGCQAAEPADDIESCERYLVYAAPAGNRFCLCWADAR